MEESGAEAFAQLAPASMTAPNGVEMFSMAVLERSLATANDAESLQSLQGATAAMQLLASRLKVAFDRQCELAALQIRLVRKLGGLLTNSVNRGGFRAKSYDATLTRKSPISGELPEGITKAMSARYQKAASIPEDLVGSYVQSSMDTGRLPSLAGVLRLARVERSDVRPKTTPSRPVSVSPRRSTGFQVREIVDAALRVLHPGVDAWIGGIWRVGLDALAARLICEVDDLPRGVVVVDGTGSPAAWIPQICLGVRKSKNSEGIVVLPACPEADWFRGLDDGGWYCCFLAATPHVVAYRGARTAGFRLVFSALGATFGPSHAPNL